MKARVKATGEIVEVKYDFGDDANNLPPYVQRDENGRLIAQYVADQLSWDIDAPDYWERLKHQYAGMALAGILARNDDTAAKDCIGEAEWFATALVEKMKGGEK